MGECPTCGQAMPDAGLKVDLDNNLFAYRGHALPVTPMMAEILHVLVERFPNPIAKEDLCRKIWGMHGRDFDESHALRSTISNIRKILAPVGVAVRHFSGSGYCIRISDAPIQPRTSFNALWTPEKVDELVSLCRQGVPRDEIARRLGMTIEQVRSKRDYLARTGCNIPRLALQQRTLKARAHA